LKVVDIKSFNCWAKPWWELQVWWRWISEIGWLFKVKLFVQLDWN